MITPCFISSSNLKSSMDRFIEIYEPHLQEIAEYLKSSMDRFIALHPCSVFHPILYLKSSMDRFIAENKPFLRIASL